MPELKPCPFCGGSVSIYVMSENDFNLHYVIAGNNGENRCACGVFMEGDSGFISASPKYYKTALKKSLIEKWNRRVDNG